MGNPLQGHTQSVNSDAFSPDGIDTVQAWDTPTGGQAGSALKEHTISRTLSPIHFSSSTAHALCDAQSLFVDMSNVNEHCRDLIYLQNDGWIVGPNGRLLLWVPPSYHQSFHYTPWTYLVIPRGIPELDLSKMAHGPTWYKCYTPFPNDN